jgi:predicted MFS family arabinose efflux permease
MSSPTPDFRRLGQESDPKSVGSGHESTQKAQASLAVGETRILWTLAAVQFVNTLDFMMVMPLGPDFAKSLGIAKSHLGVIASSYTAAAAVSGLLGATFLDRFDRKKALSVALLGLSVGTFAGGLATGLPSLVFARILAGMFGGPATALAISILSDTVPPERRGRAMGLVMSAFAVASVVGVPGGLELAGRLGWQSPFFAVALLALAVLALARYNLPPLRMHLERAVGATVIPLQALIRKPVLLSFAASFCASSAAFLIIPNIASYLQFNLGYPREKLGALYMMGGVVAFVTTRVGGLLSDRVGAARVGALGSLSLCGVLLLGFRFDHTLVPLPLVFVLFMFSMSLRNVAIQSLSSKVPRAQERARYGSLSSSVQHLSASAGGFLASSILAEEASGKLIGMPNVVTLAIGISLLFIAPSWLLERQVKAAEN